MKVKNRVYFQVFFQISDTWLWGGPSFSVDSGRFVFGFEFIIVHI